MFVVVRDPVDRFLSATCQVDLSISKMARQVCHAVTNSTKVFSGTLTLDCILNHIKSRRTLFYHQTHQVRQLEVVTAGSPGVAISLIPQETATEQVIASPGGHNEKVRSRTATAVAPQPQTT